MRLSCARSSTVFHFIGFHLLLVKQKIHQFQCLLSVLVSCCAVLAASGASRRNENTADTLNGGGSEHIIIAALEGKKLGPKQWGLLQYPPGLALLNALQLREPLGISH